MLRTVALILAVFALASCDDSPTDVEQTPTPTTIRLSDSSVVFGAIGDSLRVTATVLDQNGREMPNEPVDWSTDDPSVASAEDGLVKAVGVGMTTVSATADSARAEVSVSVTLVPAAIALSASNVAFEFLGETTTLTAEVVDANGNPIPGGTGEPLVWSSDEETIVSVDQDGELTAEANGVATISVTSAGLRATASATVSQVPASITLNEESYTFVEPTDQLVLVATVLDAGGSSLEAPEVIWTSSDPMVADVTDGLVVPASQGTADISAASGSVSATCEAVVVAKFFNLAPNGVTVTCPQAGVGTSEMVDGVTYTKRSRAQIDALIASEDYEKLTTTCTSCITDMSDLFRNVDADVPLESWDVSSVTTMRDMFRVNRVFSQPLNSWDVSSVTDMNGMFQNAIVFDQSLDAWDVSSVTDMGSMFKLASAFDRFIGDWDVSRVVSMDEMFLLAGSFTQPIGNWDVSSVTTMRSMFSSAGSFNQPVEGWNVSNVTDMRSMFDGARSFNQALAAWDVSSVTAMDSMFKDAWSFNQDLSGWCVSGIGSAPFQFDLNATDWLEPRPVWGTCP